MKSPAEVRYFSENQLQVAQVSCSVGSKHAFTLCLTEDGRIFAWGDHNKGQLGTIPLGSKWNHTYTLQPLPVATVMPVGATPTKIVAGAHHSSFLSTDGRLYTWGCGSDGRLGHPEYEGHVYKYLESQPKLVQALQDRVVDVTSSYYHMTVVAR